MSGGLLWTSPQAIEAQQANPLDSLVEQLDHISHMEPGTTLPKHMDTSSTAPAGSSFSSQTGTQWERQTLLFVLCVAAVISVVSGLVADVTRYSISAITQTGRQREATATAIRIGVRLLEALVWTSLVLTLKALATVFPFPLFCFLVMSGSQLVFCCCQFLGREVVVVWRRTPQGKVCGVQG